MWVYYFSFSLASMSEITELNWGFSSMPLWPKGIHGEAARASVNVKYQQGRWDFMEKQSSNAALKKIIKQ